MVVQLQHQPAGRLDGEPGEGEGQYGGKEKNGAGERSLFKRGVNRQPGQTAL